LYNEALRKPVNLIEFSQQLIKQYANKITGFAYSKVQNVTIAEDLSQDILLSLFDSLKRQEEIHDMDGFVYTVCCYTWSKFLRRHKKHWHHLGADDLFELQAPTDVEKDVQNAIFIAKLQTEIAYLTKLHRQITLQFYYENQTSESIAKALAIPHSTVRWHLTEIKKKLKAGIEMEKVSYEPQRLMVGHDGYTLGEDGQKGLGTDRLVDNICLACYGQALAVEEIARKLMVAAGYLEDHIRELVYMDYLRVVDKNKYTTTFFIKTIRHQLFAASYQYHHIAPYARKIHEAFDARYVRIKEIGFLGSDLDKDFLLWAIMPIVINTLTIKSVNAVLRRNKIRLDTPIRKDGSRHWVCATLYDDHYIEEQSEFTQEEVEFYSKSTGNGIKNNDNGTGVASFQLDSFATIQTGVHWRSFGNSHLSELDRVAYLIYNMKQPNEHDQLLIAQHVELGYVRMEDNRPKLLIPFFQKEEYDRFQTIINEMINEVGDDFFADYLEDYARQFESEIPRFLSKEEQSYHRFKLSPHYAILYWLTDNGYLRYPDDEEAKRMCTIVWRTKE
jgi:RNA polymerase sigma factor (sigma-70 family)